LRNALYKCTTYLLTYLLTYLNLSFVTKEYEKNVLSGGTYKKWIKPEVYLAVWLILTELIFANVNDSEKNYTDDTHTTNT